MSEENLTPEQPIIGEEPKKTPFADKPVDLSGMVASVLKPQTEAERAKIEREIARKQAKLKGESTVNYFTVGLTAVAVVLVLAFILLITNPSVKATLANQKKDIQLKFALAFNPELKQVKVISSVEKVETKIFVLKVKTTPVVDKVVLVSGKNKVEGKVVAKDKSGLKDWQMALSGLKKGKYEYKCYYKNTATGKFGQMSGEFLIK